MYFDTHAHLDQPDFADRIDEVVARAAEVGVTRILAVGTTLASSRRSVELAATYPGVFAAVGIHPNHAAEAMPDDWDEIVALADEPQVVAIGETGLDRHWDDTPFPVQQDYFARHMELAKSLDMPFIVHMRECEADILDSLRAAAAHGPLKGIMHSFTGDAAMAEICLDLGLHVSFAGMLTYKNAGDLRACAATIPAERLLVETDSPYLSPEPLRGRRPNEPARVVHTAACLADVRGMTAAAIAELTNGNARRLLGV